MPDRLKLELATPTRLILSEEADEVVVPGIDGYFGVLPGHAPLLAMLVAGEMTYRAGRVEGYLAVSGGFAEVGRRFGSRSRPGPRAAEIPPEPLLEKLGCQDRA